MKAAIIGRESRDESTRAPSACEAREGAHRNRQARCVDDTVTVRVPPAPERNALTAQGHPRTIFKRAVERGNYLVAVTTAREVGRLDLGEALELLNLVALHELRLYDRAARRWLVRLLEERGELTVADVQLAAAALAALPTASHGGALALSRATI